MGKSLKMCVLVVPLCLCLVLQSCNASQFEAVLNQVSPAVLTILQIVSLLTNKPVNAALPAKISADVAGIEKLYGDFGTANSTASPDIASHINAGFMVLQGDLGTVFSIANVNDQNTQLKLSALIGLINSAVQIAEAAIPAPVGVVRASKVPDLDAATLVDSWNKILTAPTGYAAVDRFTPGHKLHLHSKPIRTLTLGVAQ